MLNCVLLFTFYCEITILYHEIQIFFVQYSEISFYYQKAKIFN